MLEARHRHSCMAQLQRHVRVRSIENYPWGNRVRVARCEVPRSMVAEV
jgi:hypothetical protein